jgi:hypothetical protein
MEPRSGTHAVELADARRRRDRAASTSPSPLVMTVEAAPGVEPLLAALYRTEDIAVAPDGRRVVIPSFFGDHLLLVDLDIDRTSDRTTDRTADQAPTLRVSNPTVVQCESLRFPHGAGFVDDRTVLIANRGSELSAIEVPPAGAGPTAVSRMAKVIIGADDPVPVRAPSSLALHTADGLCEVLVCNNGSHTVTRYVLDVEAGLDVIDREVLIADGLAVPDGIAVSPSRRWIAVSNHDTHEVFLYTYEPDAGQPVRRVGTLRGANYPHGLRFADDDRMILLNDAGLPHLYVYVAEDGDWGRTHDPVRTLRVMDDDAFNAGRYNPQEGGPKGMTVLAQQGAVVLTSTHQRLCAISLDDLHDGVAFAGGTVAVRPERTPTVDDASGEPFVADLVRRSLRRVADAEADLAGERSRHSELGAAMAAQAERIAALEAQLDAMGTAAAGERDALDHDLAATQARVAVLDVELAAANERLAAVERSTCWRLTRPMRAVLDVFRRNG